MVFLAFGPVVGWCLMAYTYDGAARYRGCPCTRFCAWITLALPRPHIKLSRIPGMTYQVLLPRNADLALVCYGQSAAGVCL